MELKFTRMLLSLAKVTRDVPMVSRTRGTLGPRKDNKTMHPPSANALNTRTDRSVRLKWYFIRTPERSKLPNEYAS
jgi:hypothetical protein